MNPKELSEYDDIATSLILDPYLGFTSHKMNLTYRDCHLDNVVLKNILEHFITDKNYGKALKSIMKGEWMPHISSNFQSKHLEEHVCIKIYFVIIGIQYKNIVLKEYIFQRHLEKHVFTQVYFVIIGMQYNNIALKESIFQTHQTFISSTDL